MKMPKAVKVILWIVGILIAIPVILVATLPLWLGPIARPCVNKVVPGMTKTSFNIGKLYLNPYTGRLELGDFAMGNPEGYKEPTLAAISNLVFDVAMTTLGDKYVHVEEVIVDDVFFSLVKGGENNVDNILQLQYNLAGGKEKYEAKQAESAKAGEARKTADAAKAKAEAEAEKAKLDAMTKEQREEYLAEQELKAAEEELAAKKFVIDHVLLRNVKVKYGMMTFPVPTIELRDLGKESDGVTIGEFFNSIWQAILKSASALGDMIGDVAGAAGKAFGNAADASSKALGNAADASGKALGNAADATGKALGNAADATGKALGNAAGAAGEALGNATDKLKGLFK